jgi:hypothetical protein
MSQQMKSIHKEFYATPLDLLPGLIRIESGTKLQYVLRGLFPSPTPTGHFSAMDIPNIGLSQHGHYISEPSYLVAEAGAEILVEEVPQRNGGILYEIGLPRNPSAFVFQPAGLLRTDTVILGSVESAIDNLTSRTACAHFWRELSRGFVKIQDYYVGPGAYKLLEQGGRLTLAVQCPLNEDLRLE